MKKNGAVVIAAMLLLCMILLEGCHGTLPPEGYNCKTDQAWSGSGVSSGNNGVGNLYIGGNNQYRTELDGGALSGPGTGSMSGVQSPSNGAGNGGMGLAGNAAGETDGTLPGSGDSYMITTSNSRYIQAEELAGWTAWQLKVARNEIYARHGVIFGEGAIQDHFNTRTWYHGTVPAANFDSSVFNAYEWANIQTIQAAEAALR